MYLHRKIDKWLIDWKNKENKSPALVVGIRQCGKTKSILEFANNNYEMFFILIFGIIQNIVLILMAL